MAKDLTKTLVTAAVIATATALPYGINSSHKVSEPHSIPTKPLPVVDPNYVEKKVSDKTNSLGENETKRMILEESFKNPNLSPALSKSRTYSKKTDIQDALSPEYIYAMIRVESEGVPTARSNAGAIGLMQLLPSTAKSIDSTITEKDLYAPKKNIEIGIKYLVQLYNYAKEYRPGFEKMSPNEKGLLIAQMYNAGPTRIKDNGWKAYNISETLGYEKKIKRELGITSI